MEYVWTERKIDVYNILYIYYTLSIYTIGFQLKSFVCSFRSFRRFTELWIRSLQLGIRSPEPGNPWCGWRAGRGRRCQLRPVMFFDVFLEIFWRGWLVSFYQSFLQLQNWLSNFSRLWWSLTSWEFWWFGIYNHPWTRMEQCMFEICMIPQGFFFEPQIQMRTLTIDRKCVLEETIS